jgi:hypothetical protein
MILLVAIWRLVLIESVGLVWFVLGMVVVILLIVGVRVILIDLCFEFVNFLLLFRY